MAGQGCCLQGVQHGLDPGIVCNVIELLLLLLPVAAASGWFAARRSLREGGRWSFAKSSPAYFKGLNYILNEQPDKAIDVFVKLVEVDSETVETHLALGNLFRRRGEVDRAIRIHQNLIARQNLSKELRAQALLELGKDYMRAGLFDRAESLFEELADSNLFCEQSLKNLQIIYEQEKEWGKCLDVANKLETNTGQSMHAERAQYFCELAEQALGAGDRAQARACVQKAHSADKNCVRAIILEGDMQVADGDCRAAIETYKQVEAQAGKYFSEVLGSLIACYRRLDAGEELYAYLWDLQHKRKDIAVTLALADMVELREGPAAAGNLIAEHLRAAPSLQGLDRLIALNMASQDAVPAEETLALLHNLIADYRHKRHAFQCEQCGCTAKQLNWNCPGCKSWNSMRPIQGLKSELL